MNRPQTCFHGTRNGKYGTLSLKITNLELCQQNRHDRLVKVHGDKHKMLPKNFLQVVQFKKWLMLGSTTEAMLEENDGKEWSSRYLAHSLIFSTLQLEVKSSLML